MARHEARREAEERLACLKNLLEWAGFMGGWEAECWQEAERLVAESWECPACQRPVATCACIPARSSSVNDLPSNRIP